MQVQSRARGERLRRNLGRLFEVVTTDILVWEVREPPRMPRSPIDLRIEEVGAGMDWKAVVPRDRQRTAQPFIARRGDTGFLAFDGDTFAGWIWLSRQTHRDPWSGLHIQLARDEAYAYALWVEPAYRPKGVARALMVTMLRSVVSDPALTRVYGWVDQRNRESQMLLRLLGFKDVQTVRRAQVLHRRGRQVPGSCRPAFGPLSRHGRHRTIQTTEQT